MCVLTTQCVLWVGVTFSNSPDPFHMRGQSRPKERRLLSFLSCYVLKIHLHLFVGVCVLCVAIITREPESRAASNRGSEAEIVNKIGLFEEKSLFMM